MTSSDPANFPLSNPLDKEIWRQILPFFEHVNIADPSAYQLQKKLLISKALESLKSIKQFDIQYRNNIRFIYLCAFDNPNCGTDYLIVSPSRSSHERLPVEEGSLGSLKDILIENLVKKTDNQDKDMCVYTLKDYPDAEIIVPNNSQHLSSCRLPDLIHEFNEYTEHQLNINKPESN